MALVSGGKSSLNPNAPLFIPSYMRQVEDFSPEWWNLVKTSTWFHEHWLSENQMEDNFLESNENVVDLLPDSIDIGVDEDILNMEAMYEEFLMSTESGHANQSTGFAAKAVQQNGLGNDGALVKSLSFSRAPKSPVELPKYYEKPAKHVSPKCSPRLIQQPR
ncbi:hypothetical protein LIER_36267 [Lithospermum erythrorhizon]|uniref:Uncharacterized protein n=1 Tax=Lithospermum erythrorhizon TaxID=34254 RepID=A0AAV3P3M0_LITER